MPTMDQLVVSDELKCHYIALSLIGKFGYISLYILAAMLELQG